LSDTSEFWKAVNNFKPVPRIVFEYRAYYEQEVVTQIICDPVDADWPEGDYIVITKQQYSEFHPVNNIVVNRKLVKRINNRTRGVQLELSADGNYTSLPNNIIFVAATGDTYKLKDTQYE